MIQHVAKRISEERPELPIFTIHDSLATTVGNQDYVSLIIKEETARLTGLNAKLGLEYWG
jgi:phosphopantetheine adenylyltransferase